MTLRSALLPVQLCFCGILWWTPHRFLRCCMPKEKCTIFSTAAILLITSLCMCLMVIDCFWSSISLQIFPSKILLSPMFFHFLCWNFTQVLSQWTELNFFWPLFSFGIVSCSNCYKTCPSRLFLTPFKISKFSICVCSSLLRLNLKNIRVYLFRIYYVFKPL